MKTKLHILTAACVAALVVCAPSIAFAASKTSASPMPGASPAATASTAPSPEAKTARAVPLRGTATAVDQSAKTFAVAGKDTSRTFKATDKTTVTKDGKAATFADLADNDKVTGSYWKQDDGTLELKSLKLGATAEDEKAASPKKGKKSDDASTATASPSPSPSPKKK